MPRPAVAGRGVADGADVCYERDASNANEGGALIAISSESEVFLSGRDHPEPVLFIISNPQDLSNAILICKKSGWELLGQCRINYLTYFSALRLQP